MTHCTLHIYIDNFINLLSNQCSSQIENLLYAMRHTKYIQQYRSRIVPTISQPHLSTHIKKKKKYQNYRHYIIIHTLQLKGYGILI